MEPQGDRRVGHCLRFGETVHHPPYFGRALFPLDGERVFGGLARMDDERLSVLACRAYLSRKAMALPFEGPAHPEVIEPGFPDCDDPRRVPPLLQMPRIHRQA